MRKLLLLIPVLLLTGCLTDVPVKSAWPEVPKELLDACPALQQIDPNTTKLSEVIGVVSTNYGQYRECQVKVDAWVEWYKAQQKIVEEIK
jgi:hypothetical protein